MLNTIYRLYVLCTYVQAVGECWQENVCYAQKHILEKFFQLGCLEHREVEQGLDRCTCVTNVVA